VADGETTFRVTRHADRSDDDLGRVTCALSDGSSTGDRLLRDALGDIDEQTFSNVFAVGLGEIQELATLSGTKAAEAIYRLTSGLDRVSLHDVIGTLRRNRAQLLDEPRVPSRIGQLTARRDELRAAVERLRGDSRRFGKLALELAELDGQLAAAEQEMRQAERGARTIEIAVGLKSNWRQREKLREQVERLSGRVRLADDAIDRLNELNAAHEKHQRQADVLQGQRRQLRDESTRLGVNEILVRNFARVDALGEQRDWLESLERQREDLEREAQEFDARLAGEQRRLAESLGLKNASQLREITEDDLEKLAPHVDALRAADKRWEAARRDLEALCENERSLQTQIQSAIVGGEQHHLPMDLQEASDLVARLRRRLQVEQRLEQARQHEMDLEQQGHELLDDQVMPLWLFGWTLAAVVLGALMVGASLLVPNSPLAKYGGMVAFAGIAMSAFSFVLKYFTEDAAADRLDACQRQMETLNRQLEDFEEEKEKLDAELPLTDGSVVLRLQAAERHLAELESVLPVEAQRKQLGGEVANSQSRLQHAERQRGEALKAWRSAAAALGLPEELDPQRLGLVTDRLSLLEDLETRARHRREDAAARRRERETLVRRIRDLAEETSCLLADATADPVAQLEELQSQCRKQLAAVQHRKELRDRAAALKQEEAKHREAMAGLNRRRLAMFQSAGCEDEQAFRMLAADQHQANLLAGQLQNVSREIAAAIGKHAPEAEFAELLSPDAVGKLDALWEAAAAALEKAQHRLKTLAQRRGALQQEQESLINDRGLAEAQLDLDVVEVQLEQARDQWREHAAVSRVFERIRADYERNRQPETLAEASGYLDQLTAGRYRRIWTPLASDVLLVENRDGESLPVEVLSRGAREQLFLSVRLALVAMYARRGVLLPMVLDDVLVNCDAVRARRAAQVLCEFAAGGRQVLVFTCHEHIWQMFRDFRADCRRLPARPGGPEILEPQEPPLAAVPAAEPLPVEAPPKPAPRKRRRIPAAAAPKKSPPKRIPPAPPDFYDYPFVERVVEETIVAAPGGDRRVEVPHRADATPADDLLGLSASEFRDYAFDFEEGGDAALAVRQEPPRTAPRDERRGPRRSQRNRRDHLESRRA